MKKVLFLLIAVVITNVAAMAQPGLIRTQKMISRTAAGVVKTRAGCAACTDTMVSLISNRDTTSNFYRCGYEYDVSVDATFSKLTGYLRGTSKLKGSMDSTGSPWYTIRGDRTTCPSCIDSVYSFTDVTSQFARWEVPRNKYKYLKVESMTDTNVVQTSFINANMHYSWP